MQEILVPIGVMATLAIGLVAFTKTLTDYFIRKKLVDKGLVGDDAISILKRQSNSASKFGALKWGLIVLFVGIGIIITEAAGYSWERSAMPYGIIAITVALGFLIYYFVIKDKVDE